MAASTNEEALAGIKLLTPFPVADSNDNDNKYSTDLALLTQLVIGKWWVFFQEIIITKIYDKYGTAEIPRMALKSFFYKFHRVWEYSPHLTQYLLWMWWGKGSIILFIFVSVFRLAGSSHTLHCTPDIEQFLKSGSNLLFAPALRDSIYVQL